MRSSPVSLSVGRLPGVLDTGALAGLGFGIDGRRLEKDSQAQKPEAELNGGHVVQGEFQEHQQAGYEAAPTYYAEDVP